MPKSIHPKGGSKARIKSGGSQEVVRESTYKERDKHQLKSYFNDLAKAIKGANAIVIFGPSDTNEKFKKNLLLNHKALSTKIKAIVKADSMTDNQVKALVKEFFNRKAERFTQIDNE